MKRAYFVAILAVVAFLASPAFGGPVTIDLSFDGQPQGYVEVIRTFNSGSSGAKAGLFHMIINSGSGGTLDTFCVQIGIGLAKTNTTYTVVDPIDGYSNQAGSKFYGGEGVLSADEVTLLERLWSNALPDIYAESNTTVKAQLSAALQLAIWELVYDNTAKNIVGHYNVDDGLFQVVSGNADVEAARKKANEWLTLADKTWNTGTDLVILHSDNSQDLLAPKSVPEPASMLLLGLGVVGVGLIRRRAQA